MENEKANGVHDKTTSLETADDADVSREPSEYRPVDHYLIRARRDFGPTSETRSDPPITSRVTRACITAGDVRDAQGDCKKFVAEVDGVDWQLIFSGDLVLTAYATGHHTPADSLMEVSR